MNKTKILTLIISLATLVGCAQTRWMNAHGNEQQFRMDAADCQNQAMGAIGNAPQQPVQYYNPQNPYAGLMASQQNLSANINVASQRMYFYENCLISKAITKLPIN